MGIHHLTGTTLGQYELRELLGAGGMGAVYRGYQANLKRYVAVKVISAELVQQPGYLERFTREAETSAALQHPNIIRIYDYGMQGGISYIVLEMLGGGTLAERVAQRAEADDPLPSMGEIANLLRQLGSALDYAHGEGVIHRDIKPSNVMFDNHGNAYLVDFGIAKLAQATQALTESGMVIGTWGFMAPEQWRAGELSAATDQYALGVMTYALVTGQMPFEAPTPANIMHKHLNEMPSPPHSFRPEIPEAITLVLERALAKRAEERFPTCTAFAQAFDSAIRGNTGEKTAFFTTPVQRRAPAASRVFTPSEAPPLSSNTAERPVYRHPVLWIAGLVIVALLVVIGVLALGGGGENGGDTPEPGAGVGAVATTLPTSSAVVVLDTVTPRATETPAPQPTITPSPEPSGTPDDQATLEAAMALLQTQTAEAWTPTATKDVPATAAALLAETQAAVDAVNTQAVADANATGTQNAADMAGTQAVVIANTQDALNMQATRDVNTTATQIVVDATSTQAAAMGMTTTAEALNAQSTQESVNQTATAVALPPTATPQPNVIYDRGGEELYRFEYGDAWPAGGFSSLVLRELGTVLAARVGMTGVEADQLIQQGGLQIYSSLDADYQQIAEDAAQAQIDNIKAQYNATNAAVVVIHPLTGEILALVGAVDGSEDMSMVLRDAGSGIRPFVYAAALEQRWTPAQVIWDTETQFVFEGQPTYVPRNYDMQYHGPVRLRNALANAYNVPAIKALRYVGINNVLAVVNRLGVTSLGTNADAYGLSLPVGGSYLSLLELTAAYAVLANTGEYVAPTTIVCVTDSAGSILYEYNTQCPASATPTGDSVHMAVSLRQALDSRVAFVLNDMLADNSSRAQAMGINSALYTPDLPTSAVTGITYDLSDAWTVGYTRNVVVGVWVGNSDFTPMVNVSGLTAAAPIWNAVITELYRDPALADNLHTGDADDGHLTPPPGLTALPVCNPTSLQDPITTCSTVTEWMLDSSAVIFDAAGNPLEMVEGYGEYVVLVGEYAFYEIEPGVIRTLVMPLTEEQANALVAADASGQPVTPRYCLVPPGMEDQFSGTQTQLFLTPPSDPDEGYRARLWAESRNLAILPQYLCDPVLFAAEVTEEPALDLGTVVVGMNAEYPPFESIDQNGNFTGFDVDLVAALAEVGGFEYELVNTRWDGILVTLADGEFDMVASAVTITPEREESVDFSLPYFYVAQRVVVRQADASQIQGFGDLDGRRVGVQAGTTGDFAASDNLPEAEVARYDDIALAFQGLANGDVDAVIGDDAILVDIIARNPDMGAVLVGEPYLAEFYGIAVNSDRADVLAVVNAGLQTLVATGEFQMLYEQWFDVPPSDALIEAIIGKVSAADPLDLAYNFSGGNDNWTPVVQEFDGVEMALVPAGCFMMGSDQDFREMPVWSKKSIHGESCR